MNGKISSLSVVLAFTVFLFLGEAIAMTSFSDDFQSNYRDLFKNVEELKDYTRKNKVRLKGVHIKDVDIEGCEFYGATFTKINWENLNFENGIFVEVTFDDCDFFNVNFNGSKFIDCTFKNSRIINSKLNRCTWKNGKYSDCLVENSGMVKWQGDKVGFNGGKILDTPLAQGKIQFSFNGVELDGVRILLTDGGFPLTIENSLLSEVDFSRSHFSEVIFKKVKQGEGPVRFNQSVATKFILESVEMGGGVSFSSVKAESVRIINSRMSTGFARAEIPKVIARDNEFFVFGLSRTRMPHVELVNNRIHYLALWDGLTEKLIIRNSSINELEGENFSADIVLWENVSLNGEINLTNAQVNDFRLSRLTRGPNLNLITTGSNMRFD